MCKPKILGTCVANQSLEYFKLNTWPLVLQCPNLEGLSTAAPKPFWGCLSSTPHTASLVKENGFQAPIESTGFKEATSWFPFSMP